MSAESPRAGPAGPALARSPELVALPEDPLSRALLVVAGHDSSGGAGVDADREAAQELGARVALCVTAFTEQDAHGVRRIGARAPEQWLSEARVLARARPMALKLGLLPGAAHVSAAARLALELRARLGAGFAVVLDPVIRASSGGLLLDAAGVEELLARLAELAPVLTPNLDEAAALSGLPVEELALHPPARERAARLLLERGAPAVIVKGGHGREQPLVDLLVQPERPALRIERPRRPGAGIRGSGCRFATALAVGLGRGLSLPEAARAAGELVAGRIAREQGAR